MGVALVTGAHGFIGRHLCRVLHASGFTVLGLGHGLWPPREAAFWGVTHWINGEITASNLRSLTLDYAPPDAVFHLAGGSSVATALANPREDFSRTVATTVELLEWMRLEASQARLIAVSSAAVYGADHADLISEQALVNPYSSYGYHKYLMELLCRSYGKNHGIPCVISRLFSVYGSGLRKQLLWDLCSKLDVGISPLLLGGTGDECRDWIEVADVVNALLALQPLASPEMPIFNVGTGIGTTVREIAALVINAWHGSTEHEAVAFTGDSRPGDPFSLQADATKLASIGFQQQVSVKDGVKSYVQWFKSHGRGIA